MPSPGNIKPVPSVPQFRWNQAANRYIAPNGRFVSVDRVRDALDTFISVTTDSMKAISNELAAGNITLAQWQAEMMVLSKDVNLAGAAIERGGWYNMRQKDFGRAGAKIRREYDYIQNFADDIVSGHQRLDGTLSNRASLYGEQGRVTYHDFAAATANEQGMIEEHSKRTPGESCQSCIDEENKGWVPLGELLPVGSRSCLSRCNCYMMYRNPVTGASRTV